MVIPFICVNYNSSDETIKYIENVLSLENAEDSKAIVVDNSKKNDDFLFLKNYIDNNALAEKVCLIRSENKGYFHGLNIGIDYAKQLGLIETYYVVGNNDITFEKDFITKLLALRLSLDTLILAPDVITTNNSHENPHVINKMSFLRKLKYDIYFSNYLIASFLSRFVSTDRKLKPFDPDRKNIHMGIGALYVLTPQFFKFFDKLWDKVFLYGEEAVLAGQIQSVDGKILYEPLLRCFHNESFTTSKMESKQKYKIVQNSYKIYRKFL